MDQKLRPKAYGDDGMDQIVDWMIDHPRAARIWIIVILVALITVLPVPAILFIPGFLENIKYLYHLNPAMFFLFVVVPGVITTACSLIWNIGNAWEKLGDALNISKAEESLD